MYKLIKRKMSLGVTLVELVVTLAVSSILLIALSGFIGYFVTSINKVNKFNNTTKNANDIAYQLRDYLDKKNDGNLFYQDNYLIEYQDGETSHLALSYDFSSHQLVELDLNNEENNRIIFTSIDETLNIVPSFYSESNLLKLEINYDSGAKSLSVIKQIF